MPIKSGFYKGRLGIGLDTTDNAYTSGSDTGVPLYLILMEIFVLPDALLIKMAILSIYLLP